MASEEPPFRRRVVRVVLSIVVVLPLAVFIGYGGWLVLCVLSLVGIDPRTEDGERLRHRLFEWPERNREVMRTDGRTELPWRP